MKWYIYALLFLSLNAHGQIDSAYYANLITKNYLIHRIYASNEYINSSILVMTNI